MMELKPAWQFGAALGLGMLIGLERERTRDEVGVAGAVAVAARCRWWAAWCIPLLSEPRSTGLPILLLQTQLLDLAR